MPTAAKTPLRYIVIAWPDSVAVRWSMLCACVKEGRASTVRLAIVNRRFVPRAADGD
jgi:hypothetical protein